MKKTAVLALAMCLGCIAGAATQAQEKKTSLKPAPGPSDALLKQWNDIGRKLTAMAEDFPADKYDFKAARRRVLRSGCYTPRLRTIFSPT
jgi:hypothetical protein